LYITSAVWQGTEQGFCCMLWDSCGGSHLTSRIVGLRKKRYARRVAKMAIIDVQKQKANVNFMKGK